MQNRHDLHGTLGNDAKLLTRCRESFPELLKSSYLVVHSASCELRMPNSGGFKKCTCFPELRTASGVVFK
jgi:hypothetical protein